MSVSEYIAELVRAELNGRSFGKLATLKDFTDKNKEMLKKWQVPAKYFGIIESISVETDTERQKAVAAGKRIACCVYTIILKRGYINMATGSRIIRTDKTKEIRALIVKCCSYDKHEKCDNL